MKKIYMMLLAMAAAMATFTSCSDNDSTFFATSETDYPRFLNSEFSGVKGGEPYTLPSITRDINFKFTAKVTPADYTKVTWEIDGEIAEWEVDGKMVSEGKTIDIPLMAGEHSVVIYATTKTAQTYRNCKLLVNALEGDPSLAADAKPRWLAPGSTANIGGTNLAEVVGVMVDGEYLPDFKNNGSSLSFTVPAELLPVGVTKATYQMVLETSDGSLCGGGPITVTTEDYPAVSVDVDLISEACTPGWDLNTEAVGMVDLINAGYIQVGSKITLELADVGESCVLAPINSDWTSVINGKGDPDRADLYPEPGATSATITIDATCIEQMKKGLYFAGQNYTLKKVTVEAVLGNNVDLLTTPCTPEWDLSNGIALMPKLINWGLVPVGTEMELELSNVADGCVVAPINSDWASIVNGLYDPNRADLHPEEGATSAIITIDATGIETMKKGLYFAGQKYTLNRVTLKY